MDLPKMTFDQQQRILKAAIEWGECECDDTIFCDHELGLAQALKEVEIYNRGDI